MASDANYYNHGNNNNNEGSDMNAYYAQDYVDLTPPAWLNGYPQHQQQSSADQQVYSNNSTGGDNYYEQQQTTAMYPTQMADYSTDEQHDLSGTHIQGDDPSNAAAANMGQEYDYYDEQGNYCQCGPTAAGDHNGMDHPSYLDLSRAVYEAAQNVEFVEMTSSDDDDRDSGNEQDNRRHRRRAAHRRDRHRRKKNEIKESTSELVKKMGNTLGFSCYTLKYSNNKDHSRYSYTPNDSDFSSDDDSSSSSSSDHEFSPRHLHSSKRNGALFKMLPQTHRNYKSKSLLNKNYQNRSCSSSDSSSNSTASKNHKHKHDKHHRHQRNNYAKKIAAHGHHHDDNSSHYLTDQYVTGDDGSFNSSDYTIPGISTPDMTQSYAHGSGADFTVMGHDDYESDLNSYANRRMKEVQGSLFNSGSDSESSAHSKKSLDLDDLGKRAQQLLRHTKGKSLSLHNVFEAARRS